MDQESFNHDLVAKLLTKSFAAESVCEQRITVSSFNTEGPKNSFDVKAGNCWFQDDWYLQTDWHYNYELHTSLSELFKPFKSKCSDGYYYFSIERTFSKRKTYGVFTKQKTRTHYFLFIL